MIGGAGGYVSRTAGFFPITKISATPIARLATASHCGCVRPANQTGLRRMSV